MQELFQFQELHIFSLNGMTLIWMRDVKLKKKKEKKKEKEKELLQAVDELLNWVRTGRAKHRRAKHRQGCKRLLYNALNDWDLISAKPGIQIQWQSQQIPRSTMLNLHIQLEKNPAIYRKGSDCLNVSVVVTSCNT